MTGRIHHDLRAPAAAIEGYARLLLDGRAGDLTGKQRSYVEAIVASCRILHSLVETMRLGAAVEAGGGLDGPGGEAGRALERVAEGFARAFEPRRVRLRVETGSIPVRRGADLIETVAANLLIAALHTADEGAEVVLRASNAGGRIRVEAAGPGVAAPADAAGLSIVEEAVRRLGGRIERAEGRLEVVLPAGVLS